MADNLDKYYKQSQVFSKSQPNFLEHLCGLDIDCEPYSVRHTGIICTIGKKICTNKPEVAFYIENN